MNILIVKLGAIGDIVHTLPTVAAIRRAAPETRISWLVEQRYAEILRGNPLIDELIEIDTRSLKKTRNAARLLPGLRRQFAGLRRSSFDIAIDLQGLLKSAIITGLSGAGRRWGFSRANMREPAGRVFYTDTFRAPAGVHVIRKNMGLGSAATGLRLEGCEIEFPIAVSGHCADEARSLVERFGPDLAILNPAGGWATKIWDAANYGALADRLWQAHGLVSLITTGPGDGEILDRVLSASQTGKARGVQVGLGTFYELARRAKVYVGGDTGPTHIAIAARAPVVGIFGPTEWWRNGSPDPSDICVGREDIGCRVDCHRRTCSKWVCMDITLDTVFEAVQQRLDVAASQNGHPLSSIPRRNAVMIGKNSIPTEE